MRIHKEGYSTLIILGLILVSIGIGAWFLILVNWLKILTFLILISFYLFILRFFRNPDRPVTLNTNGIISPADGLVVSVQEEFEPEYYKDMRIKIAIFMSGHDVHINWSPISGFIPYHTYLPGKHLLARNPKSSELNERTRTVIEMNKTRTLLMSQIAGVMARRVVSHLKTGQTTEQGTEMGFIKLGSRVEIYLPLGCEIKVQPGQKVKGRKSLLAEWTD